MCKEKAIEILKKAVSEVQDFNNTFSDESNGPGYWHCFACGNTTNAVWQFGKIVKGGAHEINHEENCWLIEAQKLISEQGV